jgi:sulfite exporter TauE/SafE
MMAVAPLVAALLAGLLGGAHCLAMCGGFVTALSSRAPRVDAHALVPLRTLARRTVAYNLGRISTYAVLGALVGAAGALALGSPAWLPIQRALYVIANLLLLALAVAILSRGTTPALLQRLGGAAFGRVLPVIRALRAHDALPARYALGMIWGLVPCALTYSVLPVAAFAGGPLEGAAVMLVFGAGTLPNLLAAAWIVSNARRWLESRVVRFGAAAVLAGFAGLGIWRAVYGSLSAANGAFCF